jgi:hypothetical protein
VNVTDSASHERARRSDNHVARRRSQLIACSAPRATYPVAQQAIGTPAAARRKACWCSGASAGCSRIQATSSGVAPGYFAVTRQDAGHRRLPRCVRRTTGERHQRAAVVVSNMRRRPSSSAISRAAHASLVAARSKSAATGSLAPATAGASR